MNHAAVKIVDADGDMPEVWAAIGVAFPFGNRPLAVLGEGSSKQAAEEDARQKAAARLTQP